MTYRIDRKLPGEDWKPRIVVQASLTDLLELIDTLTESNPGNEYKAVRLTTQEEIDNAIQD